MDRKRLMQPPFQIRLTEGVEILVTLIGAHYNFMDHIAKRMQYFCLYTEHFFFARCVLARSYLPGLLS